MRGATTRLTPAAAAPAPLAAVAKAARGGESRAEQPDFPLEVAAETVRAGHAFPCERPWRAGKGACSLVNLGPEMILFSPQLTGK